MRTGAGSRGSAPAIATSLGCLEASLEAVRTAVTAMRAATLAPAEHAPSTSVRIDGEALQIRAAFDRLAGDLAVGRSSCAAVRTLVGPVLAGR